MVNDILTLMAHSAQTPFPQHTAGVFTQSVTENYEAKNRKMLVAPIKTLIL